MNVYSLETGASLSFAKKEGKTIYFYQAAYFDKCIHLNLLKPT